MTEPCTVTKWVRHRFKANADDYRPVTFPPPGPYWCSGYGGFNAAFQADHAIVIAYLPAGVAVTDYWPEAEAIESEPHDAIVYTDRFARPAWWTGE